MKLIISPYVGVGPLRFGMTRAEVRLSLSSTPREVQKSMTSPLKTDSFRDWNLHVSYRDDYICNAVELWRGANPVLHGCELMATRYTALLDEFRKLDTNLEIAVGTFISRQFGISVHSPDPAGTPESVLAFERGYYDG